MPVSRPLTFSSGLWNAQDTNSPVQLPPLNIPLRPVEAPASASAPSNSTPASPGGSSVPSLDSWGDVGRSRSYYSARESTERSEQDLRLRSPGYYRNLSSHRQSEGAEAQSLSGSYHVDPGGPRPFQSGFPAPPTTSYSHQEAYRAGQNGSSYDSGVSRSVGYQPHSAGPAGSQAHPRLHIRQQPIAARACGFGERDRRLVDPPPILQLSTAAGSADPPAVMAAYSSTSFSVVQASLWDESGQYDVTFAQPTNRKPGGRLMGTTFTTSASAKDENDRQGIFFAFPDLSCRTYGRFRLRFALMIIDSSSGRVGGRTPILDYAMSEPFTVYSASVSSKTLEDVKY